MTFTEKVIFINEGLEELRQNKNNPGYLKKESEYFNKWVTIHTEMNHKANISPENRTKFYYQRNQ